MRGELIPCLVLITLAYSQANPILVECPEPNTFAFPNGTCYVPTSTEPCDEGKWALVSTDNLLSCENITCKGDKVPLDGVCTYILDPLACEGIGERLFVNKHGERVCDCDEGWGRGDDGTCYQEFTVGFCEENTIVRINKTRCQADTWDSKVKDCVFPFRHNNTLYTGCAGHDWPEALSEEVEGAPWCATAVNSNLTLKGDNWGLCTSDCPLDKDEESILYEGDFSLRMLRLSHKAMIGVMQCEDNPCGDPRISLPHISTWDPDNITCHQVVGDLAGCEVYVDEEDNLKCCDQKDTLKCEAAHTANHLTLLSVANSCDGRDDCKCGGGYIWSSFREQCVQLFKGAPPRIETDDITTEVSEDTTEVVIVTSTHTEVSEDTTEVVIVTSTHTEVEEDSSETTTSPQVIENL